MNESAKNPYSQLASLLKKQGEGSLTFREARELIQLHERATADLSLARERGLPEADILQPLVMQSFNAIYGGRMKPRRTGLKALIDLFAEAPGVVRKFGNHVLIVTLTITFSAIGGAYAVAVSDRVAPVAVLGEGIVEYFESALEEEGDWALAASIPREMRPTASAFIIENNIRLTVFAFVIGIFLGYWTLGISFVNGYMLGYITALYVNAGIQSGNSEFIYYYLAGILPHGVLEIPAIILGSAGGVAIGISWLFPGKTTRLANLQRIAREVLPLLAVATVLLIVAGLIEGFVTPLGGKVVTERAVSTIADRMPIYISKIVLSGLILLPLVLWLSGGKAEKPTRRARATLRG